MEETLSQVYSTNEEKSKIIILEESSTEESESVCSHENINREKDTKNDSENEEPTVTYYPIVVKELIYFNIF